MSKPLDRLTLLETFVRISERGSISAAARDLGLSQASASRQLKELENRLGVELVRRTTHDLALTPSGGSLLADARNVLTDWEALEERHRSERHGIRGDLKVVAPVALGQLHLADIAIAFQNAHPEISLTWQLDDAPIRFAQVGCDCWIKIGLIPDDTLIVRQLGRVERLVVAAPKCAAGQQDLTEEKAKVLPFIALTPFEADQISLGAKDGRRLNFRPGVKLSTNNIMAVRRAAISGLGAAILPRWFIEKDLIEGRLVDILPAWRAAELPIHLAFAPSRHRPRRLDLFMDAVAEGLAAIPGIRPA